MDGTLTVPMFDFPRIKAEIGLPACEPILEAMEKMDPTQRRAAEIILHRHENEAAEAATLNPGCIELLQWLKSRGVRTALVTRNRRRSVETVLGRWGLSLDVLITREDGKFKPDPEPLLAACRRLEVEPQTAWMIGDGQYDIEAGLAAGIATVWVSHGKARPFAAEPWRQVRDLIELIKLMHCCA